MDWGRVIAPVVIIVVVGIIVVLSRSDINIDDFIKF
jgi:hypothetical protein